VDDESSPSAHNPAQAEVLAALGARPHERPEFDPRLRAELREELQDRLAPVAARVPQGEVLWVSKHLLSSVHGCEGMFLAQQAEDFAWSPHTARGTVAHKAIELAISWRGDPSAGELVDESIARLIAGNDSLADYLGGLGEGERAELHGEAVERTAMFLECFPRLEARWRPVAESRLRADLNDDKIVLSGKVDLSDNQLDRLLSCMGRRLEVVRRPVVPDLTRSERRSWQLHRRLSTLLKRDSFNEWRPRIERNLDRVRDGVTGQPHERNLQRWRELVDRGDLPGLHRVLTGLDRDSIEMREVSPMSGLLPEEQRREILQLAG